MDALMRRVAGGLSLIMPVTVHMRHHTNKIEEEHHLAQGIQ